MKRHILIVIALTLAACQRNEVPATEAPDRPQAIGPGSGVQDRSGFPCPEEAPVDSCSRPVASYGEGGVS